MPESRSLITATFFVDLIQRLGIRPPPPTGFEMSNVVIPVSLVDSNITLAASVSSTLLNTPFTAGDLVNPALNTVLADTLAQAAGNYVVYLNHGSDVGPATDYNLVLQRRDAANAANIWQMRMRVGSNGDLERNLYVTLSLNERLRVLVQGAVPGAGVTVNCALFLRAVS